MVTPKAMVENPSASTTVKCQRAMVEASLKAKADPTKA